MNTYFIEMIQEEYREDRVDINNYYQLLYEYTDMLNIRSRKLNRREYDVDFYKLDTWNKGCLE